MNPSSIIEESASKFQDDKDVSFKTTEISVARSKDVKNLQVKKSGENKAYRKLFVLIACFMKTFLCMGFTFSMSVLNVEFLNEFKESRAQTSLVQSAAMGTIYIAGTFCGPCVARYGARITGIFGGILATLGLGFSFFATSIPFLVVSIGIVSGIGMSASFISSMTSIGEYFEGKSKLLALSFVSCGSGFGGMVFPFLLDILIRSLGWQKTLLCIAGLFSLILPFSAVCKPRSVGVSTTDMRKIYTVMDEKEKTTDQSSQATHGRREMMYKIFKTLRLLGKDKVYVIYVLAITCSLSALNSVKIFIIDYLDTKGYGSQSGLLLFFCLNLTTTISMIMPGFCKYIPRISVLVIPAIFSSIGVIANASLPSTTTYAQHVVVLICYGISHGGVITTVSMTTMKLVGVENYPVGMGIVMTLVGIASVCAGPLSGFLRDKTGSYDVSFYSVAIAVGVATILYIAAVKFKKSDDNTIEIIIVPNERQRSRRRSSILPWKGGVDFL